MTVSMNVCVVCDGPADWKHMYGSLLTYWWVDWRCDDHRCDDCVLEVP